MQEINFLSLQQTKLKQEASRIANYKVSLFGFLACYSLIILGFFSYTLFLNHQIKVTQGEIENQRQEITKEVATETKQIYLKNKLLLFGNLWRETGNYQGLAEGIFNLIPAGVEINNFKIDPAKVITFEGKASSFQALVNLMNNLKKGKLGDNLSLTWVDMGKVEFAENSKFRFQASLASQLTKENSD